MLVKLQNGLKSACAGVRSPCPSQSSGKKGEIPVSAQRALTALKPREHSVSEQRATWEDRRVSSGKPSLRRPSRPEHGVASQFPCPRPLSPRHAAPLLVGLSSLPGRGLRCRSSLGASCRHLPPRSQELLRQPHGGRFLTDLSKLSSTRLLDVTSPPTTELLEFAFLLLLL